MKGVSERPFLRPLHWPQTWKQVHMCHLDRTIIDINWQIAHGVLYTGVGLAYEFHMTNVNLCCYCGVDDGTLLQLSFECELA